MSQKKVWITTFNRSSNSHFFLGHLVVFTSSFMKSWKMLMKILQMNILKSAFLSGWKSVSKPLHSYQRGRDKRIKWHFLYFKRKLSHFWLQWLCFTSKIRNKEVNYRIFWIEKLDEFNCACVYKWDLQSSFLMIFVEKMG